jgi:hypothetical protein
VLGPCRDFRGRESRGDSHAKTRHAKSRNTPFDRLRSQPVVAWRKLAPSACSRGPSFTKGPVDISAKIPAGNRRANSAQDLKIQRPGGQRTLPR